MHVCGLWCVCVVCGGVWFVSVCIHVWCVMCVCVFCGVCVHACDVCVCALMCVEVWGACAILEDVFRQEDCRLAYIKSRDGNLGERSNQRNLRMAGI